MALNLLHRRYRNGAVNKRTLNFIQKGKPQQNGYIKRYNRTYGDEVLSQFAFEDLKQAPRLSGLDVDLFQ
ncbi:MAG: integrase core domain-containing protein [Chryseolinea sp.]